MKRGRRRCTYGFAYVFLPLTLLILATVACGGFQVRVTPIATSALTPPPGGLATSQPTALQPVPTAMATVLLPTRAPGATATRTPVGGATSTPATGLAPGKLARVSASGGVNVRDKASASGNQVGKLAPGAIVTLRAGPTQAEEYDWWQVDATLPDGTRLVGWVAAGTKSDPWLVFEGSSGPAAGGGKLVNRAVRIGDKVQVTTQEGKALTVREAPGVDAPAVARLLPGVQLIVRGGPIRQDNYLWWQLEQTTADQIKGWAAEGETGDRWLTPVEPE